MSATRDPDRIFRAWLEQMPVEAPDRTIAAVLLKATSTPQVRTPRVRWALVGVWQRNPAFRALALLGLLLTVVMLGVLVGVGRPADPLPSPPTTRPTAAATVRATTDLVVRPGEPWILYEWTATGGNGLYLVRPDGTASHQIVPDIVGLAFHADWSPDGSKIAFENNAGTVEIWVADADGSNPRPLVACEADPCKQVGYPAWSPDGRELAYMRYDHPVGEGVTGDRLAIEVVDVATGARRVVASGPAVGEVYTEYIYPRWSRDGSRIVFTINHYSNPPRDPILDSALAVVASDGSDAESPRVITDPSMFATHGDWSRTADLIVFNTYDLAYFQSTENASNLYTILPDGTGMKPLTDFGAGQDRAVIPTWTPDGLRIVFTTVGSQRLITTIDADGSNLETLGVNGTDARLRPT